MMRADVFRESGGFDPSVVAGEEPELCQRLRVKGWRILRIDAEMTLHDAAILRFNQWWRRMVRGGYGAMDVATRFGSQGLFARHVRSTRTWAMGWPLSVVVVALVVAMMGGVRWGLAAAGVMILTLPVQMLRIALRARNRFGRLPDAIAYGILTMLSKWADMLGQLSYLRDRRAGRVARMIEYKSAAAPVARAAGL